MGKRLDPLFSALTFLALVAVLLAGGWVLSHSIDRARSQPEPVPAPIQIAPVHIALAEEAYPTPIPASEPAYDPAIPLPPELQQVLWAACGEADVPVALALGLIEVESCFQVDAVSPEGCYGLCQLNPRFFPDKLSPADNLREGIAYLGRLMEQYDDTGAALTAYNAGYDTGNRGYANAVLESAERWSDTLKKEATQ